MTQTGFFSRIINRVIYQTLADAPDVGGAVGPGNIQRGTGYRQGTVLPAVLFYVESATYDSGGHTEQAEHITAGTYRFVVRVDGDGASDSDIAPIAEAQFRALAGLIHDTDDGYYLTFRALGELPMPSYIEDGTPYQRLGTIYEVTVTKG